LVLRKENERNIKFVSKAKAVRFKEMPMQKGKPKNIEDSKKAILMKLRAQRMESKKKNKNIDDVFKVKKRLMMAKQFRKNKQDLIMEQDSESEVEVDPRYPKFAYMEMDISESEDSDDDSSMQKLKNLQNLYKDIKTNKG
jgi:Fe-S-cluster formation regulator IscX/YfhJ